jgi:hypothetical protein
LLADPDEAMYREYEQTVARVDTLEQTWHDGMRNSSRARDETRQRHLDALAIEREQIVEERDRQLAAQAARAAAMEELIAEREQLIIRRDETIAGKTGFSKQPISVPRRSSSSSLTANGSSSSATPSSPPSTGGRDGGGACRGARLATRRRQRAHCRSRTSHRRARAPDCGARRAARCGQ